MLTLDKGSVYMRLLPVYRVSNGAEEFFFSPPPTHFPQTIRMYLILD